MTADESDGGSGGWWSRQSRVVRGALIGVVAVAGVAVAGNLMGGGAEDAPTEAATTATPEATAEPEATTAAAEASEEPSAEAEPPTSEPTEDEPAVNEDPLPERVSELALNARAAGDPSVTSWADLADQYTTVFTTADEDPGALAYMYGSSDLWPAHVIDVGAAGEQGVTVTVDFHSQSPDWNLDEIGRFVGNHFMTTAGAEVTDLQYVRVLSADGVEIGHQDRSVVD